MRHLYSMLVLEEPRFPGRAIKAGFVLTHDRYNSIVNDIPYQYGPSIFEYVDHTAGV